jgi:hypothetical protein
MPTCIACERHVGLSRGSGADSPIERTLDAEAAPIEHVGVDHRHYHVPVAEQVEVVAGLQEVGRERVPQRVDRRGLDYAGSAQGILSAFYTTVS